MKRKDIRAAALTDEVSLFENVQNIKEPVTEETLKKVTSVHGVDHATAFLYHHIQNKHKDFISCIDSQPVTVQYVHKSVKVLIVPGMFYAEHPDIGGDGSLVQSIAERFGFETEVIRVLSRGSVEKNTSIVKQTLKENTHTCVWIVSLSKGSAETRFALEELRGTAALGNVRGWINIGGLLHGTPHADKKLETYVSRKVWELTLRVLGVDTTVTQQIATSNAKMQRCMLIDEHIDTTHIVGFPLLAHIEPLLVTRHKLLATQGPNDGIILLKDLLHMSGNVYPIWGADHFLRTHEMSKIIYKICNYINNQEHSL